MSEPKPKLYDAKIDRNARPASQEEVERVRIILDMLLERGGEVDDAVRGIAKAVGIIFIPRPPAVNVLDLSAGAELLVRTHHTDREPMRMRVRRIDYHSQYSPDLYHVDYQPGWGNSRSVEIRVELVGYPEQSRDEQARFRGIAPGTMIIDESTRVPDEIAEELRGLAVSGEILRGPRQVAKLPQSLTERERFRDVANRMTQDAKKPEPTTVPNGGKKITK